jgi:hypothetical protein
VLELNGVMVICFWLHKQAGWVRRFDSVSTQYLFLSFIAQHVMQVTLPRYAVLKHRPNSNFLSDRHVHLTSGLKRRETMKTGSFCLKKRQVDSHFLSRFT